jgi:hypothetical protein
LPEPLLVVPELLALEAGAAALEPVLALVLLELDDDPHAASRSAAAAKPARLAVLPRESNPAVLLMSGAPSSASSAATRPTRSVPSHMFTERGAEINSSVA